MPNIRIDPLDPFQIPDGNLRRLHKLLAAGHAESNAKEPYRTLADTIAFLRYPPESERRMYWLAATGGDPAAFAQLTLPPGSPVAHAVVLVAPGARRRGLGRRELDAVCVEARARGYDRVSGQHATFAGARFAAAVGATDTRRDVRAVLDLAQADLHFEPIAGYRLETWRGAAPDELIESYVCTRRAINDAPGTTDADREHWDAGLVRDLERTLERRGRQIQVTAALTPQNQVVAFTELRVSPAPAAVATTEDTAVLPDHRSRGLARSVKVESLRQLAGRRPDIVMVATTNGEDNTAMRRINAQVGFRPVATHTSCVLPVAGFAGVATG
jgi:mycothiol synthase